MFYDVSITIPANTAKTSPTTVTLKLTHGVITKVIVRPRPGHSALAHLVVMYLNTQIWPTNLDGDLHGDKDPIEWNEHQEIFTEPFELKLVGWNDDDTYEHTFDFGVNLLSQWAILPYAITKAFKDLVSLLSPRRIFGG